MSLAVLGATGRLGRMLRWSWGEAGARWHGRSAAADDLRDVQTLIDMRGALTGDLMQNVAIAREALDLAQASGVAHVLLPSTAAVYGRLAGPLTEDRAAPAAPYGEAKHAMEEMAAAHPQPNTALRICNIAGADVILGGWRPEFALDQFADGATPERSYLGPRGFAQIIAALAQQKDLPRVLNVAPLNVVAMGDLLDAARLIWRPKPADTNAIQRVQLDTTRLARHVALTSVDAARVVADWQAYREGAD